MTREIFFCKSWFIAHKKLTDSWSEEQARRAHMARQSYAVLVDSEQKPSCFLNVSHNYVGVCFLDERLRNYLVYQFQAIKDGRLFLSMATHRTFAGDTDKVVQGDSWIFKPDGKVHMRKEYFNPHRLETADTTTDVESNYSLFPEFGEYDDLIRKDR